MTKSKYSFKPDITDIMVDTAIRWIDQSLVEYIPIMIAYPAFSAKLLEVALAHPGTTAWRRISDENIMRTMEMLACPAVAETPALLFDPDFVRDLLNYAINGNQSVDVAATAPKAEVEGADIADKSLGDP